MGKRVAGGLGEGGILGLLPFDIPVVMGAWGLGSGRFPFIQSQNSEGDSEQGERGPLLA